MMKLSRTPRWFDLSRHPLAAVPLILALCLGLNGLAHADTTDNFNRSNGGLGSNWTVNVISDSPLQIVGNQLQETYGQYSESLYTGSTLGGNQFTEVLYVTAFSQGVINLRVRARQYTTSGTGDGYTGQIVSSGWGSTWKIIRVDNEAETVLASGSYTYADGDTFYFEANGSTLTLKKNGTTLGSATDTSYTTGDAGFGMYDHTTLALDNWRGGTLDSGDTVAPTAPTGLSATAVSSSQINLAWTASTDNVGVTGYQIEGCQGSGCSTFSLITTVTGTSYSQTGLTASTPYTYRIRAKDAAENLSSYSGSSSATTQASSGAQATDNFNRSNGGLGSNWTVNVISDSPLQIVGNQLQETYGQYSESLYTGSTFGSNQFTEVLYVTAFSQGVINLRVRARQYTTSGTGDGYTGQIVSSGWGSTWKIIRVDNEAETVLASGSYTYADGDTFYFEANGSTLTLKKNGTTLGSATDTAYTTGDAGFGMYDHTTLALDNWRGGELGGGSDTTPPSAPSGLSATATSSTQINLSWTASTDDVGVTGYRVERCAGVSCSSFAQIGTPTSTTYSDTGLTASTSYSYRVRASDGAGNLSSYSSTAPAATSSGTDNPPSAPSGLTATAASGTQINLSWTAATDDHGVSSYLIERCAGSGCSTFSQIATATGTTYNNTGLTTSTTYSYRVRASDTISQTGGYSNVASATAAASASGTYTPDSTGRLHTVTTGSGTVTYTYDAVGNVTSIQVSP